MKVLHLDSGIFLEQSVSRQVSQNIVNKLKEKQDITLFHRDLVANPVPHLAADELLAEEKPLIDELVQELLDADTLVIGAPMYNFTIPTQLKAWFDRVLQAGVTFKYTEQGPQGLVNGKKVYIASGRGGIYSQGEAQAMDHQESYLKQVLAFIGITDVTIIRAEGMNMGDEPRQQGFKEAEQEIETI
ncbi:FMN-dependent NADH-azoreductase [Idiomarina loihiensis]|jgi:FMN-dependent NADH-azoreductase|uniref:FMN-dependent NADH:quinone oxidoreductase 1 n=1 Tax=Idiomarina loihiensis (strain ATCC BAA-735 / DSM 15497 / L2-TR) TaxID=283942 RepID=AZOR1_IDILO|nr:NAD(P)H-dependent oxidoreductase [Idiomarina loihiensis]Q5QYY9.1 RecName: Full=FMN-dependent NADH:quinone oxidoreductase 1; AltName: Full=Azo-dye reductase 1; AltName: Full=FMN-dependent NADH-azo compound oxidoreductase 1; AltName: Full=FMN-dependent NADH-azoreductase 1 [Idiomarina loihiensis L2TR]AAV82132.1 Acyl carrier protein phosphodiesterase [Idiomarina loihiensis L2TR]AGM36162.1 ACP phosphodiesterase [Idiomarina loihiensis GSL 199]